MVTILLVLGSLLILGSVVFFHELGHFLAAKISNVAVSRFSIGFGRAIWQREFRGTLYQVAPIPCGGFVEIIGHSDNGEEVEAQLSRLEGKLSTANIDRLRDRRYWFRNRPGWAQLLVAAGGPLFSFLFTMIVFTLLGWTLGGSTPVGRPEILSVQPNTPAAKAGLKSSDAIVSIDGKLMEDSEQVIEAIGTSGGAELKLELLRDGQSLRLSITPVSNLDAGSNPDMPYRIGIALKPQEFTPKEMGLLEATRESAGMVGNSIQRTAKMVVMLTTGKLPISSLNGPVGVTQAGTDWVRAGLIPALIFAAIISSGIGALQLVPIPPLDGARILFACWKMLTGRQVNGKFERVLTAVGFFALLGLMLFVSAREVWGLFV